VADHPNAAVIRELLDAFADGNIAAIESRVHPDCVWRFPGRRGALAGEHRGRDAVFAFFGKVMALTDGTFGMDVTDVVAGDDRAVVLFRGHGSRPDGRTLDNPTSLVIRLDDGRAIEVDEFVWDLEAVESFW
jgi:uncharacterized protein